MSSAGQTNEQPSAVLERHHHITLNVDGAQEDYDFHTVVLGLKSVKKTMLYDGLVPIYHLYYGNDVGQESTLVTTFPRRHQGKSGTPGSGQISALNLSIPASSLAWWRARLVGNGFEVLTSEQLGEQVLEFSHPSGIPYRLVGSADDDRLPATSSDVPAEFGIRGVHGIDVTVADGDRAGAFMADLWSCRPTLNEASVQRWEMGAGGPGTIVDVVIDSGIRPGIDGDGIVNHCAFHVADFDVQAEVKRKLLTADCANVTKVFDRGYFDSVYVDIPEGAVFEATVSKERGFATDESWDSLGGEIKISPQLEGDREALLARVEPLVW